MMKIQLKQNDFYPYRDKQQDPPLTYCEVCQQGIWNDFAYYHNGLILCNACYMKEKYNDREAEN